MVGSHNRFMWYCPVMSFCIHTNVVVAQEINTSPLVHEVATSNPGKYLPMCLFQFLSLSWTSLTSVKETWTYIISLKSPTRLEQTWRSILLPSLYEKRPLPSCGAVKGWYYYLWYYMRTVWSRTVVTLSSHTRDVWGRTVVILILTKYICFESF